MWYQGQPRWTIVITYVVLHFMPYTDALNDNERVVREKNGAWEILVGVRDEKRMRATLTW